MHDSDEWRCPVTGDAVRLLRDPASGAVYGLAKPRVRSMQFHVESVLTENGPAIVDGLLRAITAEAADKCPQTVVSGRTYSR